MAKTVVGLPLGRRFSVGAICALLVFFHFFPVTGPKGDNLIDPGRILHGFSNPALITVLALLVIGQGMVRTGVLDHGARFLLFVSRGKGGPFLAMLSALVIVIVVSAFLNNIPVVVIFIPIMQALAARFGQSGSKWMMPLSFAAVFGGMITLIGTPPNIVVAEFRGDALGESYRMFDFAPVGLACAAVGVAYVALLGWRLLPRDRRAQDSRAELFDLAHYIVEVRVSEDAKIIGKRVRDLDELADKVDVDILGLTRRGRRMPGLARTVEIKAGDILGEFLAQLGEIVAVDLHAALFHPRQHRDHRPVDHFVDARDLLRGHAPGEALP